MTTTFLRERKPKRHHLPRRSMHRPHLLVIGIACSTAVHATRNGWYKQLTWALSSSTHDYFTDKQFQQELSSQQSADEEIIWYVPLSPLKIGRQQIRSNNFPPAGQRRQSLRRKRKDSSEILLENHLVMRKVIAMHSGRQLELNMLGEACYGMGLRMRKTNTKTNWRRSWWPGKLAEQLIATYFLAALSLLRTGVFAKNWSKKVIKILQLLLVKYNNKQTNKKPNLQDSRPFDQLCPKLGAILYLLVVWLRFKRFKVSK